MEKLYFKTIGQEPDAECIEPCPYQGRPAEGTMIGSASCQGCNSCYGWDIEESWVKCLDYSLEKQSLQERVVDGTKPFDRFGAGIKKYGFDSEFRKECQSLLQQLRHDELEEFFDKWDVPKN